MYNLCLFLQSRLKMLKLSLDQCFFLILMSTPKLFQVLQQTLQLVLAKDVQYIHFSLFQQLMWAKVSSTTLKGTFRQQGYRVSHSTQVNIVVSCSRTSSQCNLHRVPVQSDGVIATLTFVVSKLINNNERLGGILKMSKH